MENQIKEPALFIAHDLFDMGPSRSLTSRRIPPHPRSRPDTAHAIDHATSASCVAPVHRIVPRPNSVLRQVRHSAANPGIRQRRHLLQPSLQEMRNEADWISASPLPRPPHYLDAMTSHRPSMHPLDKTMRTLSS
uniref:Uncharacterized protein n=1 Tax=Oryza sativa subsp. japonica TaxID=39947 RepID=Q6YYG4_ORYSJ|nr:hypothetical protein [Oryza sativa Japonica Group]